MKTNEMSAEQLFANSTRYSMFQFRRLDQILTRIDITFRLPGLVLLLLDQISGH